MVFKRQWIQKKFNFQALFNLTPCAPQYIVGYGMQSLLAQTKSIDLNARHGAILALGEIIYALSLIDGVVLGEFLLTPVSSISHTNIDKLTCLKRHGRFLEPADVIHLLMVTVLAVIQHKMWTISLPPALVRSPFFCRYYATRLSSLWTVWVVLCSVLKFFYLLRVLL